MFVFKSLVSIFKREVKNVSNLKDNEIENYLKERLDKKAEKTVIIERLK